MPNAPDSRTVTSLRRELALACDGDGYVTWTDQAAVALLGASIGARLTTYAALGSVEKLEKLLRRGREERVEGFDVDLLVNGRPTNMAFSAEPTTGGVVLVGNLIPDAYGHEMRRLNRELDDSAAGVMALHDEVDEKTDSLRRITEVKSRVVANVSHEFRTPLNAVIGLSK